MIIQSFATENAFYDEDQTAIKTDRIREEIDPVVVKLSKGQKIVKKGFLVSDADMKNIMAIGVSAITVHFSRIIGVAAFLLIAFIMAVVLLGINSGRKPLKTKYIYLLFGGIILHFFLLFLVALFFDYRPDIPLSLFIPTVFFAMVVSILVDRRTGIVFAFLCSIALFFFEEIQIESFVFALVSGITGAVIVHNAEKRIELIK